jgi:hypothetical protein
MVFGMNKLVAIVKILEVVVILLPVIYGVAVAGEDFGGLVTPVYTPPELGFTLGDVTSTRRNDVVVLNVSLTNDSTFAVDIEAFNATLIYQDAVIGEVYLEALVHIPSGEATTIQLVVDHVNLTPLSDADENEVLELRGHLSLTMQGVQVRTPFTMPVQLKTLRDAFNEG